MKSLAALVFLFITIEVCTMIQSAHLHKQLKNIEATQAVLIEQCNDLSNRVTRVGSIVQYTMKDVTNIVDMEKTELTSISRGLQNQVVILNLLKKSE